MCQIIVNINIIRIKSYKSKKYKICIYGKNDKIIERLVNNILLISDPYMKEGNIKMRILKKKDINKYLSTIWNYNVLNDEWIFNENNILKLRFKNQKNKYIQLFSILDVIKNNQK